MEIEVHEVMFYFEKEHEDDWHNSGFHSPLFTNSKKAFEFAEKVMNGEIILPSCAFTNVQTKETEYHKPYDYCVHTRFIDDENDLITMVDFEHLYQLTQENNAMLKEIVEYVRNVQSGDSFQCNR